jgi:hypothetical protein
MSHRVGGAEKHSLKMFEAAQLRRPFYVNAITNPSRPELLATGQFDCDRMAGWKPGGRERILVE